MNMKRSCTLTGMVLILLVVLCGSLNAETNPWNSRLDSLAPDTPRSDSSGATGGTLRLNMSEAAPPAAPKQAAAPQVRALITPALKGVVLIGSAESLVREGISGVRGLEIRGPHCAKLSLRLYRSVHRCVRRIRVTSLRSSQTLAFAAGLRNR